ncbi:condensin subunit Smc [Roseiarcus fermentans]|uniref:Chromosome partition protein Smc n=1 Tax=Roseiarcus fermentans TaxID=1473586 RepID=A0A366ERX2_9HYPH|nr:AAA family ATPase [Roseiarcus fermentans]RBP05131.1 condensin subunit Smc [Roseiarcus fermentans]
MKFERLRVTGFKSFCDTQEFKIEPGLTGVVGPNGCGKSNLVESLRWVMGESSFKAMRASGMDDVIFSGSGKRPSRNNAEVGILLDNSDRRAPAVFNDHETIEVTRRIERESGSTYRVNGREVRARDVQLLFADASTGARSPALVRQGQIGEIIAAKPQARRLILEEAAGISGLHSRRHEAELRLKGAEDNLLRVEDVLKQIEVQVESLRRQARQSARYRHLAAEIRRNEALAHLIAWREAETAFADAAKKLDSDLVDVAERTRAQGEAARRQALAAAELPGLREEEARRAAALQRIAIARETLDAEEKRAATRGAELERRLAELARDLAREQALIADAVSVLARLDEEDATLAAALDGAGDVSTQAREREEAAGRALAVAEADLNEAQAASSDLNARRHALAAAAAEEGRRLARLEADHAKISADLAALRDGAFEDEEHERRAEAAAELAEALETAEQATLFAEEKHAEAREAEAATRGPLSDAERKAQALETEARTLAKLLGARTDARFAPVVDAISVARGFEAALGAALGDDLDAPTDEAAPAHWSLLPGFGGDPKLPDGVEPLAAQVAAPPALARRLTQVGLCARADGDRLSTFLEVGQRLVSREGDLWRWDGFVAAAEAPTPAARRLVEKNRLGDLEREAEAARQAAEVVRGAAERAQEALRRAAASETEWRARARAARAASDAARSALGEFERRRAETLTRLRAMEEAAARAKAACDESAERKAEAEAALADLVPSDELTLRLERARAAAGEARAAHADARASAQNLSREAEARRARRQAIEAERRSWATRRETAEVQIEGVAERRAAAEEEREDLAGAPFEFARRRRLLADEVAAAEAARKEAADALSLGETALAAADRAAREALELMGRARESRAAAEARVEATRARRADLLATIQSDLDIEPEGLAALAGATPGAPLPALADVQKKLDSFRQDRERLGAVNLRAEEELAEVEGARDKLIAERDDLTEAIRKLRGAIGSLNQEGRARLLAAFDVVNGHFKSLFSTLFEGGEAELLLVESDDPLHAGLEILAKPPGKKPQTLTLLSGGEQALTAMSLIFAVFLTNPSPICVLDEVDAPLDDYNVERFCDLLEEMRKRADTKFVTITHNPITMARMDRLFGVTMAERGVSQIVSVELAEAEKLMEAG